MADDPEDEEELEALLHDVQVLFHSLAHADTKDEERLATFFAGLGLLADKLSEKSE